MNQTKPKRKSLIGRAFTLPIPLTICITALCSIALFLVNTNANQRFFNQDTNQVVYNIVPENANNLNTGIKNGFKLKQIYHNCADGKIHRRLNVNSKFLESYQIHQFENSDQILDADLFEGNNPFEYEFNLKSTGQPITRLQNRNPDFVESYLDYALEVGQEEVSKISLDWVTDYITVPNITDTETVLNLALMSADAYVNLPGDTEWEDVGKPFNQTDRFGWAEGGVRGHVFADHTGSTVIIAIKGTSAAMLNSGDDTTVEQDKTNDNLLFSCCCARVSSLWSTVCDCYESSYTCNQNCLERELRRQDRYYKAVLDIYRNVTYMYPDSEIWVTGHSLGGALGSLLGRTFGLPAVTYEAPGELLATRRLHLPMPPGFPVEMEHIWHFGNTADPIYLGVCNGASSSCALAGYAMETQCHSGKKCTYDSVTDLGWHVNVLNHRLRKVIEDVLKVYNETAECVKAPPCYDCFNWKFVDHSRERYRRPTTPLPSSQPTDPADDKKCLKRTWYGRCYEWEGDISSTTSSTTSSTSMHKKTTLSTKTITKLTSSSTTKRTSSITSELTSSENTDAECLKWSWLGYCLEYGHSNGTKSSVVGSTSTLETGLKSGPSKTLSTITTSVEPSCIGYNWWYSCTKWGDETDKDPAETTSKLNKVTHTSISASATLSTAEPTCLNYFLGLYCREWSEQEGEENGES